MLKRIVSLFLVLLSGAGARAASLPENPYVFGNVRITVITEGLFRAEYTTDGRFSDDRTLFAWNREARCPDCRIERLDSMTWLISTPRMKIRYVADGYPFGIFNLNVEFDNAGEKAVWNTRRSAFPSEKNLRGAVATLDRVDGRCELDEGILSRDGFYLVDDTGRDRIVDGWLAPAPANYIQDYYVFVYGDDYRSALRSLGAIGGRAPMNRKYMHGVWYSRFSNYTADDYRQILREYGEHGFPLDVMVLDMDWHTMDARIGSGHGGRRSWTGYTWNRELFPDPAGLIVEFARDSVAVTLNDHPADGIRPHEACYEPFMRSLGLDPARDRTPLFDASDRSYMEQFFRHALAPHEALGTAFWWLDWQQDYIRPYVNGTRTKHLPWLNHLYYGHSQRDGRLRGCMYSRWGGIGSHRYPIQFSGDAFSSWEMLAFEVEMTATSGNAGCFFWTHDIGGHYSRESTPELYVRWTQFGALSSTLRVHSAPDAPDRRPWLWGEQAADAMRQAYRLRSELMPYIYTSLRKTHDEMLPLTRALYIDYPKEEQSYVHPQEYLFGDDLLAAPVVTPAEGPDGIAVRSVWFPGSEPWYGFGDGHRYEGGTTAEVRAALDEIPLFVRGGRIIPMQPYARRMASVPLTTLRARVYPAAKGTSATTELYEDDGLTTAYLDGACAVTRMVCEMDGDELILTVGPAVGSYDGQPGRREVVFELVGLGERAVLRRPRGASIDRSGAVPVVRLPARDIREERRIVIENPYRP